MCVIVGLGRVVGDDIIHKGMHVSRVTPGPGAQADVLLRSPGKGGGSRHDRNLSLDRVGELDSSA